MLADCPPDDDAARQLAWRRGLPMENMLTTRRATPRHEGYCVAQMIRPGTVTPAAVRGCLAGAASEGSGGARRGARLHVTRHSAAVGSSEVTMPMLFGIACRQPSSCCRYVFVRCRVGCCSFSSATSATRVFFFFFFSSPGVCVARVGQSARLREVVDNAQRVRSAQCVRAVAQPGREMRCRRFYEDVPARVPAQVVRSLRLPRSEFAYDIAARYEWWGVVAGGGKGVGRVKTRRRRGSAACVSFARLYCVRVRRARCAARCCAYIFAIIHAL